MSSNLFCTQEICTFYLLLATDSQFESFSFEDHFPHFALHSTIIVPLILDVLVIAGGTVVNETSLIFHTNLGLKSSHNLIIFPSIKSPKKFWNEYLHKVIVWGILRHTNSAYIFAKIEDYPLILKYYKENTDSMARSILVFFEETNSTQFVYHIPCIVCNETEESLVGQVNFSSLKDIWVAWYKKNSNMQGKNLIFWTPAERGETW